MMKKVVFICVCLMGLVFTNGFHFYSSEALSVKKFSDIKDSHWAQSAIYQMAEKGVVSGFPDGTFRPDAVITADQFITMMIMVHTEIYEGGVRDWSTKWWDTLNLYNQSELVRQKFDFKSSKTEYWAQSYINQAINMGFLKLSDGIFDGNYKKLLTRENAAFLLDEWLSFYEQSDSVRYVELAKNGITDYYAISERVNQYVLKTVIKGVLRGYPDNTFRPNRFVTRAEAITIMQSLSDRKTRNPYKPDLTGTFNTSLTWKDGSQRIVVFQTKEFLDATKIIEIAGSKTDGASRGNKMHFSFYKDDVTIDDYEKRSQHNIGLNVSPLEMGFGIGEHDDTYEFGLHINESFLAAHKEAYDTITNFLFTEEVSVFNQKVLAHLRKYKKVYPEKIDGEEYNINGRSVRMSPLLGTERITIYISEQR
ncbi:MAG TPA: S-layer homology domain-containing protein [Bacilli bacterium]